MSNEEASRLIMFIWRNVAPGLRQTTLAKLPGEFPEVDWRAFADESDDAFEPAATMARALREAATR